MVQSDGSEAALSRTLIWLHKQRKLAAFIHLAFDVRALDDHALFDDTLCLEGKLEHERSDEGEQKRLHSLRSRREPSQQVDGENKLTRPVRSDIQCTRVDHPGM